jgi:hypothetical protein
VSDARAATRLHTMSMPAPLRRVGGDGGTTQVLKALGENGETQ